MNIIENKKQNKVLIYVYSYITGTYSYKNVLKLKISFELNRSFVAVFWLPIVTNI